MSAASQPLLREERRTVDGRVRIARVAAPARGSTLAGELGRAIAGEVRFDAGSRALHATDASNYRQVPIGVVLPRTIADVERTLALLRRLGLRHEVRKHGRCGMAGGFGFDAEKYEVSQAIAEQGAGRGTVHIAELAAACLRREA